MATDRDALVFPASFAQSRLWYIHQLEPDVPLYHIQSAYHIGGPLDVDALQRSVDELVQRHEALRTTLIAPEGDLLQVIAPALSVPLSVVDLSAVIDANPGTVQLLAREHVRRPFDLAQGPLLRLTLLRLGPQDHVLLLAMHHVASDAWSMNVFTQELSVLYDAFVHGRPSPLPPLPIQYADFSQWQRSIVQGQLLQEQLAFWKNQLAGAPPTLGLPVDRPRPARALYNGARLLHLLPGELIGAVQALSAQQQATQFMVYLAAFAVVLQRHAGQDDLVIGTPIANRTRVELEGLIGFFINMLALRLDLSGNPTFRELIQRVRRAALDAYDHQDLPFEKIIEELQPTRDPSRHPLFQALFQLIHLAPTPLDLPGLRVERLELESGIAPMDLAISLIPNEDPPKIWADYCTDLYNRDTIERLLQHYQVLLEAAVAQPDERIGYLPLLTPHERQRMLVEWNRSETTVLPQELCLHQLFEAQAQRTPEAIAIIFDQRHYTYRELNARANALAHDLIRRGVGPDVAVGVLIDHLPEVVLAVLAILKAGGAYVPLNPDHPPERLAYIVRDTALHCVLTASQLAHLLPAADIQWIETTLDGPEPAGDDASNPRSAVTPDHLAYVIYTSGSTGTPRGVVVAHRAVCNVIAYEIRTQALGPGSRVSNVVSLSYDPAIRDFFMALAPGATLCVFGIETILSPSALLDAMRENAVTHATVPTSLLAALPANELPALRFIQVGGEVCTAELVKRWAPGRRFFNAYGPTEATILTTVAECRPDGSRPSIGRPIPNTQAYILDRCLQPVPIGVTGELHLAGACLSRGYLNQPDTTADRFIPNPFSTEPGARMYRTGDLARYLPDGNIDFIGRSDFQVKVRGFRVEPGEIEVILEQHPAVHQAVVLARQDKPGDAHLVAYVVLRPRQTATPVELQDHLSQVLPYYMVPSAILVLESMPLTSSGKVDRRALPAPAHLAVPGSESFVGPRTPTEANIAEVWKQVLGVEAIGVHDNFFDLGGHSLLAMRAIALIEKQLGFRPSPRDFMFQTLAQLAAACDERAAQQDSEEPAAPSALRRAIQRLLRKGS